MANAANEGMQLGASGPSGPRGNDATIRLVLSALARQQAAAPTEQSSQAVGVEGASQLIGQYGEEQLAKHDEALAQRVEMIQSLNRFREQNELRRREIQMEAEQRRKERMMQMIASLLNAGGAIGMQAVSSGFKPEGVSEWGSSLIDAPGKSTFPVGPKTALV